MPTVVFVTLFILAMIPLALNYAGVTKTVRAKKTALKINIISAFSVCILAFVVSAGSVVLAAEGDVADAAAVAAAATNNLANVSMGAGVGMLAAALATAVSCIGAGIAVASAASAAIGAISENPGVFGKAMIFVALAEGVALYGMLISIQIINLF